MFLVSRVPGNLLLCPAAAWGIGSAESAAMCHIRLGKSKEPMSTSTCSYPQKQKKEITEVYRFKPVQT